MAGAALSVRQQLFGHARARAGPGSESAVDAYAFLFARVVDLPLRAGDLDAGRTGPLLLEYE